jgi:hypothetical protein
VRPESQTTNCENKGSHQVEMIAKSTLDDEYQAGAMSDGAFARARRTVRSMVFESITRLSQIKRAWMTTLVFLISLGVTLWMRWRFGRAAKTARATTTNAT